jgi:biotin carboxyl carrier protein
VLHTGEQALIIAVEPYTNGLLLRHNGQALLLEAAPPPSEQAGTGSAEGDEHNLQAPMPGTVTRLLVEEGQAVELNQPLLVLEAMKMEHTIASPYPGVVAKLLVEAGQLVAAGAALVEIAEQG